MKRIAITNILLISAALSISGCQTMDNIHSWLQDNPERVKVAAAGGLEGLLLAGHFTTAVLPAVIAGAGGALIGWRIADHLYEEEMEAHAEAIRFAAEGPTGKEFAWINPETGNKGAVVATEDIWTTENGSVCRDLQAAIAINDQTHAERKTVCRTKEGVWQPAG